MNKVGIITIIDNNNYGNRLQNYALENVIKGFKIKPITIKNEIYTNEKKRFLYRIIRFKILKKNKKNNVKREQYFCDFNKNINLSKHRITAFSKNKEYKYAIVGSDQVWNPNFGRLRDVDLLTFMESQKRIAYAASFGVNQIPIKKQKKVAKELKKFKAISVREDTGKKMVESLTKRSDVEVLIDPTMLLNSKEWDEVSKRPKQLDTINREKYILNYFLGNLSEERKKEIERIADKYNCEIINILEKDSPFYETGPSEFIYLEKNAFLICTDSFHSSVFAILYNTPFIVFNREDKTVNMNSRIETLLNKFKLNDRYYQGKITEDLLKCDYTEAYKILEEERKKSNIFLKKALDVKDIKEEKYE